MNESVQKASLCPGCVESFEAAGYSCRVKQDEDAKRRVCQMCGTAGWLDVYEVYRRRSGREDSPSQLR